ncbi:AI-2E family transporter [Nocardioides panacisoli]|uniref:AI-2E family transporter n=1 Tax=Nocardioides panacisoli TaxID=627624 RepID=UPI001C63A436|nr:AI-2E family transporter [Nocardioides panacisoli]QYJ03338.1 AI-2E family transporter [Nocardioides panacisoli]
MTEPDPQDRTQRPETHEAAEESRPPDHVTGADTATDPADADSDDRAGGADDAGGAADDPRAAGSGEASTPAATDRVDRSVVVHDWLRMAATAALRLILIGITVTAVLWLIGQFWVGVLPIILALIVTTVLWPPVAWLRRHRVPSSLAAFIGLIVPFAIVGGLFASLAPSVVRQSADLFDQASQGLLELQRWAQGPPVNLRNEQVAELTDSVVGWAQSSSSQIASGVFTGVGAATSALVALVLVLVLTFFFLKDGPQFLPWIRRVAGRNAGRHLTEAGTRGWVTLSGFIRAQAMVSAFDAVLIGIGLVVLQVPLAFVLALLTFFGGFVPIVGAFAVGALAVLVALVGNGWGTALAVLVIIVVVQQVESNVLQPFLQGRTMQLHAGIILIAVASGGTLFGIMGAFLAVPVAAVAASVLRYGSEQIDLRTGELAPEDVTPLTPEGAEVNAQAARRSAVYRLKDHAVD